MAAFVTRVWGRADAFEIEFAKQTDGKWCVNIPPDLKDGQYAVELYAQNSYGERAYWTGILYMHNGRACLYLNKTSCVLWLRPLRCSLKFIGTKTELKLEKVVCLWKILYLKKAKFEKLNILSVRLPRTKVLSLHKHPGNLSDLMVK